MGLLAKAIVANVSLVTILSTGYVTYINHEPIKRMSGNLLYSDVPVAEGHFTDPHGLRVETIINEKGMRETYLTHRPTGSKVAVTDDLFPDTASMLETLVERHAETSLSREESTAYLMQLHRIQEQLYKNMEY